MHQFFINPTPKQFYHLMLIYLVMSFVLGCFLTNGGIVFIATLLGLISLLGAYLFSVDEKVQDKNAVKKDIFAIFIMPLIMLSLLLTSGGIFSKPLPLHKSQLNTTTGIVPETAYHLKKTKGITEFLRINERNFICNNGYTPACGYVYQYKGKMATVYHDGNLVYEIVVHDDPPIVVYEFYQQLHKFQEVRKKNLTDWFFAFLIYILPAVYLYVMYQRAVSHLIEVSADELEEFLLEKDKSKLNTSVKRQDYSEQGWVMYVFGRLLAWMCAICLVVVLLKQSWFWVFVWLPIFMLAIIMMYFPYQTAKYHRNIRLDLIDEYDDYHEALENRQIVIQRIVIGILLLLCLLVFILAIWALFKWEIEFVMFCGLILAVLGFLLASLW